MKLSIQLHETTPRSFVHFKPIPKTEKSMRDDMRSGNDKELRLRWQVSEKMEINKKKMIKKKKYRELERSIQRDTNRHYDDTPDLCQNYDKHITCQDYFKSREWKRKRKEREGEKGKENDTDRKTTRKRIENEILVLRSSEVGKMETKEAKAGKQLFLNLKEWNESHYIYVNHQGAAYGKEKTTHLWEECFIIHNFYR